jgi:hypothetical protein
MEEKTLTTYSMWSRFRNCRKAAYWRYERELVPREEEAQPLIFGRILHGCLALWHGTGDLTQVLDFLGETYGNRGGNPDEKRDWQLATAMMQGYVLTYPTEEFRVIALERKFQGEIRNPATDALSRSFTLGCKVDGVVEMQATGEFFLLEHKTASVIDAGYLEKLWTDFQIALYSDYIERELGIKISGVLYNVLVKARLEQKAGETEEEFGLRQHEAIAKSKSGKTSIKRRMPETDEEFQTRLAAKYAEPGMFHREQLYLSKDRIAMLREELWMLTQAYLEARRAGSWYENSSHCFYYNRPCGYFPLCRANGSELVIENLYEHKPPHEELREDAPATEPVF